MKQFFYEFRNFCFALFTSQGIIYFLLTLFKLTGINDALSDALLNMMFWQISLLWIVPAALTNKFFGLNINISELSLSSIFKYNYDIYTLVSIGVIFLVIRRIMEIIISSDSRSPD